jgi:hypothetical protein
MANRNFLVLLVGLVALSFALGEHVSAKDTKAGPAHAIDAITVDLDPTIGHTTERIGIIANDQARKGYLLVGVVPCQQMIGAAGQPNQHDTAVLLFQK